MSGLNRAMGWSLFVVLGLSVAGCTEENAKSRVGASAGTERAKSTPAAKAPASTEGAKASAASTSVTAKDSASTSAASPDDAAAALAGPKLIEPAAPANAAAGADRSNSVLLGSPELTAGIPGEGPLKADAIKAWLARPGVHDVLAVELPLGLSAGRPVGLEANPLTRAKIELGRQLYFDPRLSADGTISCSSCHHPDEGWGKHTQFGVGIRNQTGNRNSPVSFNRILSGPQFWDGRAESLEAQAVGPIANPIEMGNTHEKVVDNLKGIEGYRLQFEAIFGKEGLNIDNVGKAIATFERAVVTAPSPFDYYEALRPFANQSQEDIEQLKQDDPEVYARYDKLTALAKEHPMSAEAIRGRELFFSEKVNCSACHVGANLSDEKYHNLGVGMDKKDPDLGRYALTKVEKDKGAFKTPTIRNVALSAPYMHDGSQRTLEEVVEWYNKGGHPNPWLDEKVKPLKLSEQDKKDLVAFMNACTGEFPKINVSRLPE
jgi:cytochrome c peroxidase